MGDELGKVLFVAGDEEGDRPSVGGGIFFGVLSAKKTG
jgi:hypothetical protein